MQEVAEKHKKLENDHKSVVHRLKVKEDEVKMLSQVSAVLHLLLLFAFNA